MNESRKFPWLPVILGIGCISILCITVIVVGGGAFFFLSDSSTSVQQEITQIIQPEEVFEAKTPTELEEFETETQTSEFGLTGEQKLSEFSLYDDFSSEALGWPVYDDGITILNYENQAYAFQVTQSDYVDWAYFPVDFIPYEIWFDAQGPAGEQDGNYGVFCQYQDYDNYYYVEISLYDNSYLIGQIRDGEYFPLTTENEYGDFWYFTEALYDSPTAVNRIGISCYLDSITLFINGEWVNEVNVSQPFDNPGEAAFFVYGYDTIDEDGYKVIFDNVETYQPVQ